MSAHPTRRRSWRKTLLLASGVALMSSAALAQAPEAASSEDSTELGEVVVTGTQLRGVAPVGSPIIGVDRAQIEATGAITTAQVLQLQPQVFNFGISETQRNGTGGAANITYATSINLRGLSPFATLTIVNGHRVPSTGTVGASVDPSAIPTVMLQRVDIVADGASATYGSDAIAGVVNLIMRRRYNGVEVSGQAGFADNFEERQANALVGKTWRNGQLTLGAEYAWRSNLSGRDRDFYSSDLRARGGADNRLNNCSPGTLVVNGVTYAIPAAGVTPATANLLIPGTQNKCDPVKSQDLLPEQKRYSVAATFDQEITDRISVFADAYYTHRKFQRQVPFTSGPLTVTNANPFFVAPPGTNATSATVNYWFGNQGLGDTWTSRGFSKNYQITAGFNAKLWAGWNWQAFATYGHNEDLSRDVRIDANSAEVAAALNSSNPATALNLFGPNNPALLASLNNNLFGAPGKSQQYVYETKLDGPLFKLPGGEVRAAIGYQREKTTLVNGVILGTTQNSFVGFGGLQYLDRVSNAFYGEVLIPIVGGDAALPGVQKLEVDVGLRTTKYTVVGRTTNPKVGVNWYVNDELKLHGSYGRSFRAPGLSQLVGPLTAVFVQTYATPSGPLLGYTLGGGNIGLRPETATTWSFGGEWSPGFAPHFRMSLNYFNINYRNQISSYLSNLNILQDRANYSSLITDCPSAACNALIAQYIDGVGPNARPLPLFGPRLQNPGVFVNGFEQNLATTRTHGVDFQLSYAIEGTRWGDFDFGLNGTRFFKYKVTPTPGAPVANLVNRIGYPLKLRARGSLGWRNGPFNGVLFVNYQNGYTNNLATPVQRVSALTTLDLFLNLNLGDLTKAPLIRGTRLGLNVSNLFDKDPPFVNIVANGNGGGGFDPQASNPIGRVVSFSMTKSF